MAIYESGVIFADLDTTAKDCWTLDSYKKRGGYKALEKILTNKVSQ